MAGIMFALVFAGMICMLEASRAIQSAVLPQNLKSKAISSLYSPAYPAREPLADLILALSTSPLLQEALLDFLQQNAAGQKIPKSSQPAYFEPFQNLKSFGCDISLKGKTACFWQTWRSAHFKNKVVHLNPVSSHLSYLSEPQLQQNRHQDKACLFQQAMARQPLPKLLVKRFYHRLAFSSDMRSSHMPIPADLPCKGAVGTPDPCADVSITSKQIVWLSRWAANGIMTTVEL